MKQSKSKSNQSLLKDGMGGFFLFMYVKRDEFRYEMDGIRKEGY